MCIFWFLCQSHSGQSHSGHTVATGKTWGLGKGYSKGLLIQHFFLIPITEFPRFNSGHCVATVWPLSLLYKTVCAGAHGLLYGLATQLGGFHASAPDRVNVDRVVVPPWGRQIHSQNTLGKVGIVTPCCLAYRLTTWISNREGQNFQKRDLPKLTVIDRN